jgi:hypothetical protein
MKSLFVLLLSLFLSNAITTQVVAEEVPAPEVPKEEYKMPGMMKLPAFIDCGPYKDILAIVQGKYGEQPFAKFNGSIQIPNGQLILGPGALYVNVETRTWSLVVEVESAGLCITAYGQDFGAANPKKGTSL